MIELIDQASKVLLTTLLEKIINKQKVSKKTRSNRPIAKPNKNSMLEE
ncbi:MAG: hypothetical protein ABF756_05625 [Liquorilactobacillus ghanensis]